MRMTYKKNVTSGFLYVGSGDGMTSKTQLACVTHAHPCFDLLEGSPRHKLKHLDLQ